MAKWPYIANAFSELYEIMVNKVTFIGFRGGDRPHRIRPWTADSGQPV